MPDKLKELHTILDVVGEIFLVERIEEYLANGGTFIDQSLRDTDAYTAFDDANTKDFKLMTIDQLVASSLSTESQPKAVKPVAEVTQADLEHAINLGINRWVQRFSINVDELPKVFEHLKTWRFSGIPRDDIFEKAWKTKDFMELAR